MGSSGRYNRHRFSVAPEAALNFGYQFTQQQGEQGILNAASASGGVSGNTLTALDKYNTGLADPELELACAFAIGEA